MLGVTPSSHLPLLSDPRAMDVESHGVIKDAGSPGTHTDMLQWFYPACRDLALLLSVYYSVDSIYLPVI